MSDDRTPVNAAAERNVIGSMYMDADFAMPIATETLVASDFYDERNRTLFSALVEIHEKNIPMTAVAVREYLEPLGSWEKAGGNLYLSELMMEVATAASVRYHASVVLEKSQLRALRRVGLGIVQTTQETDGRSVQEVMDHAAQSVFEATSDRSAGQRAKRLGSHILPTCEWAESSRKGIPTGWRDLDEMTGGVLPGHLWIIAARPGVGKSAFAGNLAVSAARQRRPVGFYTLEMTLEECTARALCSEARVDLARFIRKGPKGLNADEQDRIIQASANLNTFPLYLDAQGGLSITQLRAKVRRDKSEHGLEMVVVDYLQKLRGKGENRNQEVGEISRGLKAMALELNIPVVALAQLSRKLDERADKRPVLSDLRESGEIEQDADEVMFIYRPEYHFGPTMKVGRGKSESTQNVEGMAEIIIAKQRNGAEGSAHLRYVKEFTLFEDLADNRTWRVA